MVGVLQRFEHRLQEMYDGGFARAFKSELQPTEVAGAVQRGKRRIVRLQDGELGDISTIDHAAERALAQVRCK